jgi:hypothetical protein
MSRANKKWKEVFILIFEALGPAFTFAEIKDGTFKDQTLKVTIIEKDTKFEKKKDSKFEYLKSFFKAEKSFIIYCSLIHNTDF